MGSKPTIWLICNEASGSNDDQAVSGLCERLAPARAFAVPRDELPDAATLAAGKPDILAIFTGDGTANAALSIAEGFGGQILMLPGGTTNLLSRSLHGDDSTLDDILTAFERGELVPTARPWMETSKGLAHSEILAGPGATWSDVRETLRELDVEGMARTAGEALQQTTSGPSVVVAEPETGSAEGYPGLLLTIVDKEIRIDGYHAEGLVDYFRQGVALLLRDFREGPHDELGRHREVVLRSEASIDLMMDGERCTGDAEERITLRIADLSFLSLRAGTPG